MADDGYEYLEPGFDPASFTVPKLRSILVTHDVSYPASAKKPDLINLFNENILPQAKKLREQQIRIRRTSKGIVSVSPGGNAIDKRHEYVEEDELPPLETPARKSSRRSGRASTEDMVAATPRTSRSTRQSTAPPTGIRGSVKPVSSYDGTAEGLEVPKPRTTRKSVSPAAEDTKADESPFTQDNPFQKGSPPPTARSKSGTRRRTTMGQTYDEDRHKSRDSRRKTEGYTNGTLQKASTKSNTPAPGFKQESDDDIQPGEEFTPDQQLELDTALAGDRALVRRPQKRRSGAAKAAPWSIFVALLGGVATVWRQEKLAVGYCGIGSPSPAVGGVEIPEWASAIRPQCEPCPQHAYCYADLKTVCEPDFVLTPHPLSLGGVIPLPPTCEPDGEKARRVKAVADFAVEKELREHNAKYECGEVKSAEVPVEELKTAVSSKRSRKMSDREFDELWESALGEIVGREEVVSGSDGSRALLRSTSLARVPFSCAVRRSLHAALRQHLPKLVAVIFLSLSAVYGKHALTVRKSTSSRAKILAGSALEKLAWQASVHAEDPVAYPESYISMVALRDDVLRQEFNVKERGRLWEVVKGLVEGNANVRSMVREGRAGEVSRVWEWIGAVQRIESPDGRRGSTRFSLGGPGRITGPSTPQAGYTTDQGEKSDFEVSRWTEGNTSYF
ncbi:Man1-Src1p-C-terminal domain-containing protein [Elsinoe ampelina]|uniref:Man1-Src1p-C-terminal domain-containing protein n=1 Tax=Elsinoe ampelina TaxID=302913 RepID=A0A6A6GRQ9_9PEZI|nr:Man1-Src1p-C-terminal domain-containing protein [Elsinoe ampelina]